MEFLPSTSKMAQSVLIERYLLPSDTSEVDLYRRVADAVCKGEPKKFRDRMFRLMSEKIFLPNTPCLANAGVEKRQQQLSGCFVLPIHDTRESIMKTVSDAVFVHASGGGTGFSFSQLRPRGDTISTTTGRTSGPVSFLKMYDAVTDVIQQGGMRRGANMGVLRVDHPDIMEFIKCKCAGEIPNFNISVGITDVFMNNLLNDLEFDLINPRTGGVASTLPAMEIWEALISSAWACGDPGIIFLDTVNRADTTPELGLIEACNPCGEQPLHPYEACVLGSINLTKFFNENEPSKFDLEKFRVVVRDCVRFLDDVIEASEYPIPQITEAVQRSRRIGLGVMGWADLLIQMGYTYGDDDSYELARVVMSVMSEAAHFASVDLGAERGIPEANLEFSQRNAGLLTVAPTGTVSIIAGCSSGIEPNFGWIFNRSIRVSEEQTDTFRVVHPLFEKSLDALDLDLEKCDELLRENPSIFGRDFFKTLPRYFVTAHDISPEDHVDMQSEFQKYVDSGVSKTVNLPSDATVETVELIFLRAYESKCKGVTVFRDGCRGSQVLSTGGVVTPEEKREQFSRGGDMTGHTSRFTVGCGTLYITANHDESNVVREVFLTIGKAGGCACAQAEALGRVISLALQNDTPIQEIAQTLAGIRCHKPAWGNEGVQIHSCADALSVLLSSEQGVVVDRSTPAQGACPSCGGIMISGDSGCEKCSRCPYKSCS